MRLLAARDAPWAAGSDDDDADDPLLSCFKCLVTPATSGRSPGLAGSHPLIAVATSLPAFAARPACHRPRRARRRRLAAVLPHASGPGRFSTWPTTFGFGPPDYGLTEYDLAHAGAATGAAAPLVVPEAAGSAAEDAYSDNDADDPLLLSFVACARAPGPSTAPARVVTPSVPAGGAVRINSRGSYPRDSSTGKGVREGWAALGSLHIAAARFPAGAFNNTNHCQSSELVFGPLRDCPTGSSCLTHFTARDVHDCLVFTYGEPLLVVGSGAPTAKPWPSSANHETTYRWFGLTRVPVQDWPDPRLRQHVARSLRHTCIHL